VCFISVSVKRLKYPDIFEINWKILNINVYVSPQIHRKVNVSSESVITV
jgi:hypothetical protein